MALWIVWDCHLKRPKPRRRPSDVTPVLTFNGKVIAVGEPGETEEALATRILEAKP